jgi:hypothetical protein
MERKQRKKGLQEELYRKWLPETGSPLRNETPLKQAF